MRRHLVSILLLVLFVVPSSTVSAARFIDHGDGTRTDTLTGLMWQAQVDGNQYGREGAVTYCEELSLAGNSDWRIPRIDELRTLYRPPADASGPFYWSGTQQGTICAWGVRSGYGRVTLNCDDYDYPTGYVQCVRDGPFWPLDPSERLENITEQRARDTIEEYEWQRADAGPFETLDDAVAYCENLVLDDCDDWRLPAIRELETIIDYTRTDPALPDEIFEGRSEYYWSRTRMPENLHYLVHFGSGAVINLQRSKIKKMGAYARCVRWGAKPAGDFTAEPTSGYYPLQVNFFSKSLGGEISSYRWNFGDGTRSTDPHPVHTYSRPGTFNVTLTTYGPTALHKVTKKKFIVVKNRAPKVSITAPSGRKAFLAPAEITIKARASDEDGSIKWVNFFAGGRKIGRDQAEPFELVWKNVPAGVYDLKAVAVDDFNRKRESKVVRVTVGKASDLALTMNEPGSPAKVGDLITYFMTVKNLGPDTGSNVTVTDTLPSNVEYVSAISSKGSCNKSGNSISCRLGRLPVNGEGTVEIVAKAASAGVVTNTAQVGGTEGDPNPDNNRQTVKTTVVR